VCVANQGYGTSFWCGDLSGWTFPDVFERFYMSYICCITAIPSDYSSYSNFTCLSMSNMPFLSGDVTTFSFTEPNPMTSLTFYSTSMCGDLGSWVIPTGITSLQLRLGCFTGDIGDITLPVGVNYAYMEGNDFTGNFSDFTIPSTSTRAVYFTGNNCMYWDLNTPFDTCDLQIIGVNQISGVTGSFSNLTMGDAMINLQMCYMCNPIESDLTELNLNNLQTLYVHNSGLSQDVTPMLTGSTDLQNLSLCTNLQLSGDTTDWQVDNINNLYLNSTSLSGRLCHNNPYNHSTTSIITSRTGISNTNFHVVIKTTIKIEITANEC